MLLAKHITKSAFSKPHATWQVAKCVGTFPFTDVYGRMFSGRTQATRIHSPTTFFQLNVVPRSNFAQSYNAMQCMYFGSKKRSKRTKKALFTDQRVENKEFKSEDQVQINSDKKGTTSNSDNKKKPGKIEQLKGYFKEYGWVFVTYWSSVWALNGVACFLIIEATGLDGIALLKSLGSDNIYDIGDWDPSFLNALIAIEVNELLELVRFPIIVATTPRVAKWWRSRGT